MCHVYKVLRQYKYLYKVLKAIGCLPLCLLAVSNPLPVSSAKQDESYTAAWLLSFGHVCIFMLNTISTSYVLLSFSGHVPRHSWTWAARPFSAQSGAGLFFIHFLFPIRFIVLVTLDFWGICKTWFWLGTSACSFPALYYAKRKNLNGKHSS